MSSATVVQPDGRRLFTDNSPPRDAIEIDHGSALYFVSFPEGFRPPPPPTRPQPQLSTAATKDGNLSNWRQELYCGTEDYVYQHFFADFGPLHLGHVYAFCKKLENIMEDRQQQQQEEKDAGRGIWKRPVYVYSSEHPHRRSNAAVLVLAYAVLCLGKTVEDAYAPFFGVQPPLIPYRDASFGICTYHLEVLDCARAIARAASLGHFNLDEFNPHTYAFYDKIEHGDLNWIIPGKFVAFSGPLANRREVEPGKWTLLAEDYVSIFRKMGVTCVIRFNKKCYDRRRIIEGGMKHIDLFYEDGGNPSEEILQRFLRICENVKGAIAVHCKAGLGRTGTNIALYMMKHYGYTAAESIALCRICRPGSIVGPQQQFLHCLEHRMKIEGDQYRRRHRKGACGQDSSTRGGGIGAAGTVEYGTGTSFSTSPSALFHPNRHRADRRVQGQRQPYLLTGSGSKTVRGDVSRSSTLTRRPTTSPLLMRRHSTTSSGGRGGRGRGGGAMSPTEASRRRISVGGRHMTTEDEQLVVTSSGCSGVGSGFRGLSNAPDGAGGKGYRKGEDGNCSSGPQRPRRGSAPSVGQLVHQNGEMVRRAGGRGCVKNLPTAVEGVGDLTEALRQESGAAPEGNSTSDRAPIASPARGKLVPLTASAVARNKKRVSTDATAPALQPEELKKGNTKGSLDVTNSPAGIANIVFSRATSRSGKRNTARSAEVPRKASLAWQHPVDKTRNSTSGKESVVDQDEAVGFMWDGHDHHSGPWVANESPYLVGGARERYR